MVKICLLLSWQGIEVGFMKNLIEYNLMNEPCFIFFFGLRIDFKVSYKYISITYILRYENLKILNIFIKTPLNDIFILFNFRLILN